MGATLNDIAKKVGVSQSTVSRVINGTAPISDEMKNKVYKAMKELNYHPNSLARNLAKGKSLTIGLVVDADNENAFANTFFTRSVYAMEKVAQRNGYSLLITNDVEEKSSPACELIFGHRVDGLILTASDLNQNILSALRNENIPWVVMGETSEKNGTMNWVDMDNLQGGVKAVEHLLKCGYRKIAYVADDLEAMFTKRRIQGYEKALEGINTCIIFKEKNEEELERKIIESTEQEHVDAFLCSNNIIAFQVLQALKKLGKQVPTEIGVVTFDNYPFAEYMDPPLTVVDIDTYKLGEMAAEVLINKIKDQNFIQRENLISTELIPRLSTRKV